jgi:hypothetical protein
VCFLLPAAFVWQLQHTFADSAGTAHSLESQSPILGPRVRGQGFDSSTLPKVPFGTRVFEPLCFSEAWVP